MLQTQFADFYHADPLNPTDGWGTWLQIEMYSAADVLISSTIADFASRSGVGLVGTSSIQMIEIDTSLAVFSGVEQFYFKINALDDTLTLLDQVVTQHFAFAAPCERYIKLSSRYTGFDCLNNWYGEFDVWVSPDDEFLFDNSFWIRAELLEGEDQVSKESFNARVSKSTLTEAFDLILQNIIPYWEKNRVSKMWVPGAEVYVAGSDYQIDAFSVDNKLTTQAGRMFLFNVSLNRECRLSYQCTTLDSPIGSIFSPPIVVEQCVECIDITCVGP
jgi:hypothetical protein